MRVFDSLYSVDSIAITGAIDRQSECNQGLVGMVDMVHLVGMVISVSALPMS